MAIFDIAFSLNRAIKVRSDTYEEAIQKIKNQLKKEGIDLENDYTFEEYDVVEHDETDEEEKH